MMKETRYLPERKDRYAYAEVCGRMRALEKTLLSRSRLEELQGAGNVPDAMRLLLRWGWLTVGDGREEADWEETLTESLRQSDRYLMAMDPHPRISTLLVIRYDLMNLCAVLKGKARRIPFDGHLHRRGLNTHAQLETMVNRLDFGGYPQPLAGELDCLREILIGGGPLKITNAVARAYHQSLRRAAEDEGSSLFADYLGHLADLENIASAVRGEMFPESWPDGPLLLSGGHLPPHIAAGANGPGLPLEALGKTVYGPLLERCRRHDGKLSLTRLQRETDDFLTELLVPAKYVSLGPEPLWAFYLARETDGRNIRGILFGIMAGESPEDIGSNLRSPYV